MLVLIPVVNIHEVPKSLFPHRRSGHYNDAGYAVVAAVVIEELQKANAVPLTGPRPEVACCRQGWEHMGCGVS